MEHPQHLQIIPTVSRSAVPFHRSPVPFYEASIAFTDHSYRFQFTCTILWSIHSFYRSFLFSSGHLYLFADHPQLLQIIPIVSRSPVPFYGPSIAFTDHSYCPQVTYTFLWTIHSFYRLFLSSPGNLYLFTDHPQLLQIIPILSRSPEPFYRPSIALLIIPIVSSSPVPFYGPSIAFTDHSYPHQVICTFLRTIHSFYRSFLSSPDHLYLFTNNHSFYRSFISSPCHLYHFTDYPQLLQMIPIISRSPVPFYSASIAFTDPSYRFQLTCIYLQSIHSIYRSFLPSPGQLYHFTDHMYHFTKHQQLLQIIPIVSRSPVPFYEPSIAFADHSYRLQVTCTFLQTIHSFHRLFLSSPGHLYLFTNHPQLLQIIPIVSRSPVPFYGPSIAFTDHSYSHQVTCTFLQTIHSFHRSFLSSPGHLYLFTESIAFTDHSYRLQVSCTILQITCTFLRSINSFYRSFLPFLVHLYYFMEDPQLLQIILTVSRSPVPFNGASIAFTDHSYRLQGTCTFLRTIHSCYRSFLSPPGHLYIFTDHSQLLQIIPIVSRSPVPFTNHPQLLQIILIVSRSPVPFYRPSIAFTDHSYRPQVTYTFVWTIHSFYRSFLSSPGHLYLFMDHLQLLQIIPIHTR